MKRDSLPEINSSNINRDAYAKTDARPKSEIVTGIDDDDSDDAKASAQEEKIPKLKKHPGAPKRFRT
jgi:hypothetical protein